MGPFSTFHTVKAKKGGWKEMRDQSDDKLDRLLRGAFPTVEVSPDFTLRLWHRLMKTGRPTWMLPVPVLGLAAAVGVVTGVWTWNQVLPSGTDRTLLTNLRQVDRLDLFGNAPVDSVAGNVLRLMEEG